MFKKAYLFCGLILFIANSSLAADRFPFLGQVTAQRTNVRSGPDVNFERLCQLNINDELVVVQRSGDWYQIKLPPSALCYVSEKYLQVLSDHVGLISGNRVNIRARPNEKSAVLGQLNKGTSVRIKGLDSGWFQIEPVEGVTGWISTKFVGFKSNTIPAMISIEVPPPVVKPQEAVIVEEQNIFITPPDEMKPISKPLEPIVEPIVPRSEHESLSFTMSGILKDSGRIRQDRHIHHKILGDDGRIYFIKGDQGLLNNFVGYHVRIEGEISADAGGLKYQVIKIQKVVPL